MNAYFLKLAGPSRERVRIEAIDLDEARNAAIRHLGSYLSDHPDFASEGHWRLDVEDDLGKVRTTVIVATVTPRNS